MNKAKLLAATLAATSIFPLSAPAFAGEPDQIVDAGIVSVAEDTEIDTETMDVMECTENDTDISASAESDGSVENDVSDEGVEAVEAAENMKEETIIDDTEAAVSPAMSSTAATRVYTNEYGQTVYEADNAVVYINKDGVSGCMYINTNKYNKRRMSTFRGSVEEIYSISAVGDISRKDIIKFNADGYVSYIEGQIGSGYGISSNLYDSGIKVRASGPDAFWSGSQGYVTFTDKAGVSDTLTIFKHAEDEHTLNNDSDDPYVTMVEWHSESSDEYLSVVYPDKQI